MRQAGHLKKIIATCFMLVFLVAILTTATYAWFEQAVSARVQQIELSVSGASNLLISISKDGTYADKIPTEDIEPYLKEINNGPTGGLVPVSTVSCRNFFAMQSSNADKKASVFEIREKDSGYYLAIPLWLKCELDLDIYLGEGTEIKVSGYQEDSPLSQYLDRTIRVGFEPEGEDAIIYEPQKGIKDMPRRKSTTEGKEGEDYGIVSINPTLNFQQQATYSSPEILVPFTKTDGTDAEVNGRKKLTTLTADTPKEVMLYLWIEGMDYDCIDGVGGSNLSVDLKFIGVENEAQ